MSKKVKHFKNKRLLSVIWIIAFLLAYFLLFAQWKVDLTYSAEDLKVRTIDNKKQFEDKIVKNIYNKIVESCKSTIPQVKHRNEFNDFDFFTETSSISSSMDLKVSNISIGRWIATNSIMSDSIGSTSFDWTKKEVIETENVSFSQTNVQKQKVDEWDILKQTKDYIFYFSKTKSKIFIVKSPVKNKNIDLLNVSIIHTIDIPSNLTIKPELFVNDNRLVYLASKKAYNNNNTIVWIYDISDLENKKVKLHKIFETKWEYFKSRLIDKNLYLISDYSLKPFKNQFCNVIKKDTSSSFWNLISFFTGIEFTWFWINQELFNELKEELESYSYNFDDTNLNDLWISQPLDNFKVFYTNKDLKESIENLNFNIITVLDMDKKETKNTQTLVFWNLQNGEIHMTLDNLYLVNSYFQDEKWKCDYIDICYKEFSSNNFTSISKISYKGKDMEYLKTSIIPWKPLNQYSMDEDEWYFRIFTAHWSRNRDAALYIFDKKFKLIWELEDIKPWEEFKSSRFIWDKAFLVTFRQTDPLFVVDLHIPSTPKIIWELHIPWYSSYLHPYWKIWNKEYLIWIWKENNNVKVDLYEIDYEKLWLWSQIDVKQKYKYIFKWQSSISPAETNPRSFVWDKDKKNLYLPIDIRSSSPDGKFSWLKILNILVNSPIKEISSYYSDTTDILSSRVWYYRTSLDEVPFFVGTDSISFFWQYYNAKKVSFY